MGITSIKRDWGVKPSLIRITTTDTLAQVESDGYLNDQEENISAINRGSFEYAVGDGAIVYASDGSDIYQVSDDFSSLIPDGGGVTPGPYLRKDQNLMDVDNPDSAFT